MVPTATDPAEGTNVNSFPSDSRQQAAELDRIDDRIAEVTGIRPTSGGASPLPQRIVPPPTAPMAVARALVQALYANNSNKLVLRCHRDDFYKWDGTCWIEIGVRDVRGESYTWLENAVYDDEKKGLTRFSPSRRKIDDVVDALRAITIIDSSKNAPCWTNGISNPQAGEIVSMANGLLHLPTRKLISHTPYFFTHHSLPFSFEPDAPPPIRWLAFLRELWPNDPTSSDSLQEVIGYLLGGDTRLQKISMLVGPKRGGKGTIGRVLTGLLGAHNVAAPTLAGIATNFGLSPLIGKPLALVSDARLGRGDSKIVVERLLSVSGEDSLTIDRKYKDPWTGRLPTRFVVLTNELPRLTDSSGALASRFIVFVLSKSFYGRENPKLTEELLAEAPSIFNWALQGLDRLNQRGHFLEPQSGKEAVQQLEDLSSPVSAFIRDRCEVGPDHQVQVDELWAAWKAWCEDQNRHRGTKAIFGRDLSAACPTIRKTRPRDAGDRVHVYQGIGFSGSVLHPTSAVTAVTRDGSGGGHGGHGDQPMYCQQQIDESYIDTHSRGSLSALKAREARIMERLAATWNEVETFDEVSAKILALNEKYAARELVKS